MRANFLALPACCYICLILRYNDAYALAWIILFVYSLAPSFPPTARSHSHVRYLRFSSSSLQNLLLNDERRRFRKSFFTCLHAIVWPKKNELKCNDNKSLKNITWHNWCGVGERIASISPEKKRTSEHNKWSWIFVREIFFLSSSPTAIDPTHSYCFVQSFSRSGFGMVVYCTCVATVRHTNK